ncbi:MAG: RNA polymerase subunit sigma-24 [Kiritimatiellaeota bacterium]|nr:RNA polymerase subunit sigma-24 [Kiritimatiellota bacterium]
MSRTRADTLPKVLPEKFFRYSRFAGTLAAMTFPLFAADPVVDEDGWETFQPQAKDNEMKNEKILHGVPKAHYGAGGVTPFPICLKSVSDYLDDELDYTYAIVASGAAFRLAWNTTKWDGGNVDISHAYDDQERPYRQGVTALGREFKMLWRENNSWKHPGNGTKDDFKKFIKEQIDAGRPVISLGIIGPPETCVITGYRDDGDILLGWSLFQEWMWKDFNEDGYFVTGTYWNENDFVAVMSLGEVAAPRMDAQSIILNAIAALEGRQEGNHAKGIAAYDAWKDALLNATEEDLTAIEWGQGRVMVCQGDATDCLVDGRKNASLWFRRLANENPDQPLYAEIAEQFGIVAKTIHEKTYPLLGGWHRGPENNAKLIQPETRQKIAEHIDEMKAADEKALALMKKLFEAP